MSVHDLPRPAQRAAFHLVVSHTNDADASPVGGTETTSPTLMVAAVLAPAINWHDGASRTTRSSWRVSETRPIHSRVAARHDVGDHGPQAEAKGRK